jgi:hypothetical protein
LKRKVIMVLGIVDCGLWVVDDLSYDTIAKKGRKEGQALALRW